MDSAAKLLLPGIDYFQVVFTMPDKLSSLALGNRRKMFDLLFRSAWRALKLVIEDEQRFEAVARPQGGHQILARNGQSMQPEL